MVGHNVHLVERSVFASATPRFSSHATCKLRRANPVERYPLHDSYDTGVFELQRSLTGPRNARKSHVLIGARRGIRLAAALQMFAALGAVVARDATALTFSLLFWLRSPCRVRRRFRCSGWEPSASGRATSDLARTILMTKLACPGDFMPCP